MPSKQDHIKQWKHNRNFAASIDPEFHDWIVTAVFYSAVHAVDTLLAHDKVTVTSHDARNSTLMAVNRYEKIQKNFQPLYSLCRSIRYLADPGKWVPADQIHKQVVQRYLYPIEKSVQGLISEDLHLPEFTMKAR